MAGVSLTFDASDYRGVVTRLNEWARSATMGSLYASLGAELESQTRRRIEDERTDPEGNPWKEWSPRYALTRHANHNLLQNEGKLVDSFNALAEDHQVQVGTILPYGAIHQFGGEAVGMNIPARPYLGVSAENADDLLLVAEDWITHQLRTIF